MWKKYFKRLEMLELLDIKWLKTHSPWLISPTAAEEAITLN